MERYTETVFASVCAWNSSLTLAGLHKHTHGLDYRLAEDCVAQIGRNARETIQEVASAQGRLTLLCPSLYKDFTDPKQTAKLQMPYAEGVLKLGKEMAEVFSELDCSPILFCEYPFLFDPQAKTLLLRCDATRQVQFLNVHIRRTHIVEDPISQLLHHKVTDYKRPLKVHFIGEEAEDAGGVRKEFFLLLLRDILNPDHGMFTEFPDTRRIWFKEGALEAAATYMLIGFWVMGAEVCYIVGGLSMLLPLVMLQAY
ncbi:hypothetical protein O3P69_001253 [Scylla paramamosain]|uniref:HECT-type E3 ubiquitin transferase n=1 Tax=Scylla paramamosain TaxID=85552 RepID=A0AAW0UQU6_SCYPA